MKPLCKILPALLALLLFAPVLGAKTKVIEKSAKKAPEWIYSAPEGCLLVNAEGPNVGAAQQAAMESLRQKIIASVASNVYTSTTSSMSSTTTNGELDETESYRHMAKMASAKLPFLQGISETKIRGTYWTRVRDEKTRREWIDYYIIYPFSRAEADELVRQFEQTDRSYSESLDELEASLGQIGAVSEVKQRISKLDEIKEWFFDDVRLSRTTTLQSRYRDLYKTLLPVVSGPDSRGAWHITATIGGNPVRLDTAPRASSECATSIVVRPSGDGYDITANTTDCLPEELNTIELLLRIDGHRYNSTITIHP